MGFCCSERAEHVDQLVNLRNEVSDLMEKIRAMESDKSKLEQEIHDLNDVIAVKKQEGEREQRRKERLENDVKVCSFFCLSYFTCLVHTGVLFAVCEYLGFDGNDKWYG